MHDFFDIVGLSRTAPPVEVRRACARLTRRVHPDFCRGGGAAGAGAAAAASLRAHGHVDVAVDFVAVSTLLDGIQASFFR